MSQIIYRQAKPEDSDLTYRIKTRSIKPYVTAIYGWDENFQLSFHQRFFNPDNTRILSLKEAVPGEPETDTVFGYIEIEYRETEIFLANILIVEAFQGQGLGMAVMHQLMGEADKDADKAADKTDKTDKADKATGKGKRPRGRTIRLEVFRINTRARAFYKSLGFRVIGRDRIKYLMERR